MTEGSAVGARARSTADGRGRARPRGRAEFAALAEAHRAELRLHCYRMLGSLHDAEDLVQDTLLRAWRAFHTYEGRAPLRAWLYKIATNASLDALARRPRRALPTSQRKPADPRRPPEAPVVEPIWLEPYPDDLIASAEGGPEARYDLRESVALAFLAALQTLPPRQRAVLILRDVLAYRAREVADLLDVTVPAVNSLLHRARATMTSTYHRRGREAVAQPGDQSLHVLLDRYVRAWEAADVAGLIALLREDARFAMPPSPSWYRGRRAVAEVAASRVFAGKGRWRLVATGANGMPAFGLYQQADAGGYGAVGIQVLGLERGRIADVTTFMDPRLVARFGLPAEVGA